MRDRMLDLKSNDDPPPPQQPAGGSSSRGRSNADEQPAASPVPKKSKAEKEDGGEKSAKKEKQKKGNTFHDGDLEAGRPVKEGSSVAVDGESPEMKAYFDDISTIKDQIASIKRSIDDIEALHQKSLNSISEEEVAANHKELDKMMDKTNKLSAGLRGKLKALDTDNRAISKVPGQESDARIRISQHQSVTKKFLDVMQEYQGIQTKYQDKYKQRMQRQFLIVKPQATPGEIKQMMDGEQGPVFAQQMMNTGQRGEAKRALQDIQSRHADIIRIEQSIIELQQLFMDMAVLVSAQGEMLNNIETHVGNAVEHTEAGNVALSKAIKLQKKARKKMMIIICCLIMLIIAVALAAYFGEHIALFL
ncbi:Syntaxin-1A [Geranomyces variabilis]|uniref:Syntaxin-1A n=1 Tax=Geranomyces variabilis TaxID=109894 RepID=A0AAD5TI94_9FUNG|nr:Syntaxin-1A [Geranomyces variabilis]